MEEDVYYDEEEDILSVCILPVIAQVTAVFLKIYGLCAIVSLSTQFQCDTTTLTLDVILGMLCAFLFYHDSTLYIVFLVMMSYFVMVLTSGTGKCGVSVILANLSFVFICELLLVEAAQWHQIRGTVILLMMKTTSVGFDVDGGVITPPSIILFGGYTLSPVSLIFGPFVTLPDYRKSKLTYFTRATFVSICGSLSLAYITVLLSTCILPGVVDSSSYMITSAYYTALSFRASHYFVCYTSQVAALIGGFQNVEKYSVVLPSKVEIPLSMRGVAVAWNLPMHYWLRTYVYKKSRSYGVFVAGLCTYTASSVLHGLNFQLPAVLFTVFGFSYVESILRVELATLVDSCVLVSKCGKCEHQNKVFEVPIRAVFVVVNVLQLAYLGVMFGVDTTQTEGYSWQHVLNNWAELYWYGHLLCLAGLLLTFTLRALNKAMKHKTE